MRHVLLLCGLLPSLACGLDRETIDLSGPWESVRDDTLAGPPAEGWRPFTVPGVVGGYQYTASWFRRSVEVPATWQGRSVRLHFGGVRWNSRILVNGQLVGTQLNGFDAFDLDVTAALRPGQANTILVGCHDYTGVFDPAQPKVDFAARGQARDLPVDRVLAPIGGHVTSYGIWDRCRLEASAPVHAADVTIVSSWRRKQLTVTVPVRFAPGVTGATVAAEVLERGTGRVVLTLPAATVAAAPEQPQAALTAAWPDARPWSHEDPYLYDLRVTVTPAGGGAADVRTLRFGFREIWIEGPDFYLNGAKIHFLASSWWPPNPPASDEAVRRDLQALIDANTRMFRTHTQPWPENWYTIADELGVLMIPEGAVWNDDEVYRLDDPRFWDNYRAHLLAMARHLKNHPSVVLWSLENEFAGTRINDRTPEREARLADLADAMRAADPTRPVMYESDLDPGFKADVIGLHYPNEWPREHLWPNCADWMDKPIATSGGGGGFWDSQPFLWEKKKPIYIGEYLWIPSNNPDASTIFLGDEAYRDYGWARTTAKAISWEMQLKAYRRNNVSGHSPWTMIEHGALDATNPCWVAHRDGYRKLAAFPREYDRRFFAGEVVRRTIDLYNDTLSPARLTLSAGFEGGQVVTMELPELAPGAQRVETVDLPAPAAGPATLRFALLRGGETVFEERQPCRLVERRRFVPPPDVKVWDPRGTAKALGVPPVSGPDEPWGGLLVVAPDALVPATGAADGPVVIGGDPGPGAALVERVRAGGRVLVLSQRELPGGLFGLSVVPRDSTMVFVSAPSHPVLAGLGPDDLKFWRGDHLVTQTELRRPTTGGAWPLLVTGSGQGVNASPLLEVRHGQGVALFCTLRLLEKLDTEPVAGELLRQALVYLREFRPAAGKTALWCRGPAQQEALATVGLEADPLPDAPRALNGYRTVIVVDPPAMAPLVGVAKPFLEAGGTLVLSQLSPAAARELEPLGVRGLDLQAQTAAVVKEEYASGPLAEALLREDLYWLGPQTGLVSWSPRPRAAGQVTALVTPRVARGAGTVHPCARMEVTGAVVRKEAEHVLLASGGTVTGTVRVPTAGDWVLGVTGWGTPLDNIYPLIAVRVGGRLVGTVSLASREVGTSGVRCRLAAGDQPLELRFINDQSSATEDRNAGLVEVNLVPAEGTMTMTPLTSPPAVLEQAIGRGRVIIDQIRWHDAPGNELKAQRYLASLLTAAGATFRAVGGGAVIEGEAMRLQPNLQYSRPMGDHMAMVQACWAEADLDVRRAGPYRLTIAARGVPAGEVWPHATLTLDGQRVGELTTTSESWRDYRLTVALPAGRHVLRVSYDNDVYDVAKRLDSNFYLDRIQIEPER